MLNFSGELSFGHCVLTFELSNNVSCLKLTANTEKKGSLYAYLYDSKQQLRANILLEKSEKSIHLTAESASFSGIAGELLAGRWELHLYNLEGEFRSPKMMPYRVDIALSNNDEIAVSDISQALTTQACLISDHNMVFDYQACKN